MTQQDRPTDRNKVRPDFSNVQSGSSSTAPSSSGTASRTYVVQPGDSLSKIAREQYGDATQWHRIYEANRDQIKDPDLIHPGQKIQIPAA